MAECLRADVPGSLRSLALMRGEWQYEAWGRLALQHSDRPPGRWRWLPGHLCLSSSPGTREGGLFDAAMTAVHGRETAAMMEAYDFSGIRTLADIGGGNGEMLISVLKNYPEPEGSCSTCRLWRNGPRATLRRSSTCGSVSGRGG